MSFAIINGKAHMFYSRDEWPDDMMMPPVLREIDCAIQDLEDEREGILDDLGFNLASYNDPELRASLVEDAAARLAEIPDEINALYCRWDDFWAA